ncbi:islet amyloid polypeptide [Ochotona princeps]|uniref:islet amyloid polypeptide n=1 Tax=Ochotona princeps TaxID=9978 RepID=UPI00032AF1F6|nr:islet amyloid polypeptide [Ochotona princeps]
MYILKLPVVIIVLSVAMSQLTATPVKSHQLEKRKCNTITCATQRLANFLVHSSNNFGAIFSPVNLGSKSYGKRNAVKVLNTEPLTPLPL